MSVDIIESTNGAALSELFAPRVKALGEYQVDKIAGQFCDIVP